MTKKELKKFKEQKEFKELLNNEYNLVYFEKLVRETKLTEKQLQQQLREPTEVKLANLLKIKAKKEVELWVAWSVLAFMFLTPALAMIMISYFRRGY